VGDFDRIYLGRIEGAGDALDLLERILVADGMHAIAQRDVLNVNTRLHATFSIVICDASRSAVASAADVMMSRLPA